MSPWGNSGRCSKSAICVSSACIPIWMPRKKDGSGDEPSLVGQIFQQHRLEQLADLPEPFAVGMQLVGPVRRGERARGLHELEPGALEAIQHLAEAVDEAGDDAGPERLRHPGEL